MEHVINWCVRHSFSYDDDEGDEGSGLSDGGSSGNMVMARWSKVEDQRLKGFVEQHGEHWESIAQLMKTRTDMQCQHRWNKVVNPNLIKGPWTKEVCMMTRRSRSVSQIDRWTISSTLLWFLFSLFGSLRLP